MLSEWDKAKKLKADYTAQCDEYKAAVQRYMSRKDIDLIDGEKFTVTKRSSTRNTLVKERLPEGMWDKCAISRQYSSYHLKKK
jgi:hypothetical protein